MQISQEVTLEKQASKEIYPDRQTEDKQAENRNENKTPRVLVRRKNCRPIILCIALFLFCISTVHAQIDASLSLGMLYSDNVFQLSEYDLHRFDQDHSNLEFVKTTDDLTLSTRIDLEYPIHYRWWKFTPSVTGTVSQNVSNTEKQRMDSLARIRIDRYNWNFSVLYGYYPKAYLRDFVDSDGTSKLENYSYERNLYRADLQIKPIQNTTVFMNIRREDYFYNQYWTEADGSATTSGIGLRYKFPTFSIEGSYAYRSFDNSGAKSMNDDDGSYESNIYKGVIRISPQAFNGTDTRVYNWQPYLELSKEDRFFQGDNSWYGGREYHVYGTKAGIGMNLTKKWNISLDYLHFFRNVDSSNESVVRLKEYSENRFSSTVKYKF